MDRLKTMATFARIAKLGSMAKAADQMGVSRAIVSTHLSQLEAHLGARLFNRTTRQLALTEIGAEYLSCCNRLLGELEDIELSVSQLQKQPRGHVKIASPLIFGHFRLAPLISEFIKTHPDISVSLFLYDSRMTPVMMMENAFDLVIQLGRVEDSSIGSRTLGDIRYVVCASNDYLNEHRRPIVPEDLTEHNCLVHRTRTPDSVWHLTAGEHVYSIKVSGSLSANSDTALRAGVRSGLGVAILPEYCIARELSGGDVTEILQEYRVPKREITALIPHGRRLPHKIKVILDYLNSQLPD